MKKTIIALLAALALAATVALAACVPGGGGGNGGNDPTPTPSTDPTPSPEVKSVTVSELFKYSGIYKDPYQGEVVFSFLTPKVEGPDTDYIFDINAVVQKATKEYIDPTIAAMEKGDGIGWNSVEYEAHVVGNMISMCMRWSGIMDKSMFGFETWLIKPDGTKAENSELFAAKGVTEAQVIAKVRDQLGNLVQKPDYDAIAQTNGKDMADMAMDVYNKTFSDANINGHLGYYINDEGHLAVIVKVYSVADAEYYYRILDLGF